MDFSCPLFNKLKVLTTSTTPCSLSWEERLTSSVKMKAHSKQSKWTSRSIEHFSKVILREMKLLRQSRTKLRHRLKPRRRQKPQPNRLRRLKREPQLKRLMRMKLRESNFNLFSKSNKMPKLKKKRMKKKAKTQIRKVKVAIKKKRTLNKNQILETVVKLKNMFGINL